MVRGREGRKNRKKNRCIFCRKINPVDFLKLLSFLLTHFFLPVSSHAFSLKVIRAGLRELEAGVP